MVIIFNKFILSWSGWSFTFYFLLFSQYIFTFTEVISNRKNNFFFFFYSFYSSTLPFLKIHKMVNLWATSPLLWWPVCIKMKEVREQAYRWWTYEHYVWSRVRGCLMRKSINKTSTQTKTFERNPFAKPPYGPTLFLLKWLLLYLLCVAQSDLLSS